MPGGFCTMLFCMKMSDFSGKLMLHGRKFLEIFSKKILMDKQFYMKIVIFHIKLHVQQFYMKIFNCHIKSYNGWSND